MLLGLPWAQTAKGMFFHSKQANPGHGRLPLPPPRDRDLSDRLSAPWKTTIIISGLLMPIHDLSMLLNAFQCFFNAFPCFFNTFQCFPMLFQCFFKTAGFPETRKSGFVSLSSPQVLKWLLSRSVEDLSLSAGRWPLSPPKQNPRHTLPCSLNPLPP